MARVVLRKKIVCVRFRERDLVQLDELANSLGLLSRSRLVNIALQTFLDSHVEPLPILGQKRTVNILLDIPLKERLDEMARRLRTPKAELIRIALNELAEQNRTTAIEGNRRA